MGPVLLFIQGQEKYCSVFPLLWFILLAILGKMLGSIDKTGKYIMILNKVSSVIVIIVSLIIAKNILHLIF
ncbi:putative LysE type translocator [Staphylococcus condimenti]|nr:putative LysE type translocator [Staphylococcus condimenti]